MLQAVALRLQVLVRTEDLVSRIGGDEFVILASEMTCADEATMLFSRVLSAFHEPFELEGKLFHISPSIGVCFFPTDGETPDILMRNADTAMYAAKAAGRNTYRLFAQAMHAQNAERLERAALRLELLDPRLVLQRGYALLTDTSGQAVTSIRQAQPGDALRATLSDGAVDVTVSQPRLL